ncbi:hypothetical protein [Kitasatospora griseola]|uniref:hypothetical protein n=1 Tax=Kitasatospora griseola TaxID=2064 RepID=UPI003648ED97
MAATDGRRLRHRVRLPRQLRNVPHFALRMLHALRRALRSAPHQGGQVCVLVRRVAADGGGERLFHQRPLPRDGTGPRVGGIGRHGRAGDVGGRAVADAGGTEVPGERLRTARAGPAADPA